MSESGKNFNPETSSGKESGLSCHSANFELSVLAALFLGISVSLIARIIIFKYPLFFNDVSIFNIYILYIAVGFLPVLFFPFIKKVTLIDLSFLILGITDVIILAPPVYFEKKLHSIDNSLVFCVTLIYIFIAIFGAIAAFLIRNYLRNKFLSIESSDKNLQEMNSVPLKGMPFILFFTGILIALFPYIVAVSLKADQLFQIVIIYPVMLYFLPAFNLMMLLPRQYLTLKNLSSLYLGGFLTTLVILTVGLSCSESNAGKGPGHIPAEIVFIGYFVALNFFMLLGIGFGWLMRVVLIAMAKVKSKTALR